MATNAKKSFLGENGMEKTGGLSGSYEKTTHHQAFTVRRGNSVTQIVQ